jgi:hypothetical protein
MSKDELIDYWMERAFAAEDEKVAVINQLIAIQRVLSDAALSDEGGDE